MKLFAILIFGFELLAPVLLIGSPTDFANSSTNYHIAEANQSVDLLAHLIFEEVGSEERESKNECLISVCFVEVFNELKKFEPVLITWSLPKDQFDTQPSLFTLNRVLLI